MSNQVPLVRRASSGEPIHDFGTVVKACGYFDHRHKDRSFVLKAKGISPAPHRDHEHPESPKGNLDREALEKICKDLGCVAFTTNTGRLFVRLPVKSEWVETPDENLYELSDFHPPWHHVDINYSLPAQNYVLESFSYDVEFSDDVPNDINLYLCLFGGNMNTGHFYGGFQTNVGAPANYGQSAVSNDYGLIFSRWGPCEPADVKPSPGSFQECATYEGAFASVRRHFNWKKGKYTIMLEKVNENDDGTWVRYCVKVENGEIVTVGELLFRGEKPLKLGRWMYSFVEIYGAENVYVSDALPIFKMTLSKMTINGIAIEPAASVSYWKESPLYADVYKECGRTDWHIVVHFGAPFFVSEYPVMNLYS